jgi:hypothetical protein
VLRQRIDRIALDSGQAGERRRHDDCVASAHDAGESPHPEDDSVDVHGQDPAVRVVSELGDRRDARGDTCVEACELHALDRLPRRGVRDVESVTDVQHAHVRALGLEPLHDRAPNSGGAARD